MKLGIKFGVTFAAKFGVKFPIPLFIGRDGFEGLSQTGQTFTNTWHADMFPLQSSTTFFHSLHIKLQTKTSHPKITSKEYVCFIVQPAKHQTPRRLHCPAAWVRSLLGYFYVGAGG